MLGFGGAVALVMLMSCKLFALSADETILRPGVLELLEFKRGAVRWTMVLTVVALCGLLPLYATGANLYSCGHSLARLSISYLFDAPLQEAGAACLLCVSIG